jgi:DNA (cytosine-5)-methyltransferase 1
LGLTFFDLFAGVGGFRLGMERAGHTCIGSCEWDNNARETYKKNFGSYPKYDDAKDLQPSTLPQFDVLCAGFPCQAFSIAGKRLGFEDTRGTVFFEIARIAKEKKPRYLLLENVKGLLSHDKGRTFRTILSTLDEMGYDAEWQLLNSKYFVPQNRERIFIVGHLRGERTRQIFPVGELNEQDDTKKLRQVGNIDTAGNNSLWGRVYDPSGIAANLNANGGGLGAKTGLYAVVNDKGNLREVEKSTALDANYWKGADNHAQRTMIYLSNTNANMKQRIQDRNESWTLTNNSSDFGLIENKRIRKLTPVECERLQGFPDNWTQGVSDTQRYKQMGNAVTVPVVEYLARRLE